MRKTLYCEQHTISTYIAHCSITATVLGESGAGGGVRGGGVRKSITWRTVLQDSNTGQRSATGSSREPLLCCLRDAFDVPREQLRYARRRIKYHFRVTARCIGVVHL